MSEIDTDVRELVARLAITDNAHKRFGARQHRYELLPPVTAVELAAIEARLAGAALPADYLEHITRVSAGGAGPYYGLLPAQRAAAYIQSAPGTIAQWQRALPIAHLGCAYFAVMPLDGPARGQIWLDARELAIAQQIQPSFTAFVLDWIDRLAHNQWPLGYVPVGRCALQAALTGYLHMCEEQLGLPEGTLAGAQLRDALAGLGPGAIAIGAEGPLFLDREAVDPCITCARIVENLVEQGLDPRVVAPGVPPLPAR